MQQVRKIIWICINLSLTKIKNKFFAVFCKIYSVFIFLNIISNNINKNANSSFESIYFLYLCISNNGLMQLVKYSNFLSIFTAIFLIKSLFFTRLTFIGLAQQTMLLGFFSSYCNNFSSHSLWLNVNNPYITPSIF